MQAPPDGDARQSFHVNRAGVEGAPAGSSNARRGTTFANRLVTSPKFAQPSGTPRRLGAILKQAPSRDADVIAGGKPLPRHGQRRQREHGGTGPCMPHFDRPFPTVEAVRVCTRFFCLPVWGALGLA